MSNLPAKDRDYLESKGIDYEEHAENTQEAVIIKNCSLPDGRFDVQQADVLILLPRDTRTYHQICSISYPG